MTVTKVTVTKEGAMSTATETKISGWLHLMPRLPVSHIDCNAR